MNDYIKSDLMRYYGKYDTFTFLKAESIYSKQHVSISICIAFEPVLWSDEIHRFDFMEV